MACGGAGEAAAARHAEQLSSRLHDSGGCLPCRPRALQDGAPLPRQLAPAGQGCRGDQQHTKATAPRCTIQCQSGTAMPPSRGPCPPVHRRGGSTGPAQLAAAHLRLVVDVGASVGGGPAEALVVVRLQCQHVVPPRQRLLGVGKVLREACGHPGAAGGEAGLGGRLGRGA